MPRGKIAAQARSWLSCRPFDALRQLPTNVEQRTSRSQFHRTLQAGWHPPVSLAIAVNGAISLHYVFVARLPSAPEKQPQRLEKLSQISPGTSTRALGERTVCIEPARSIRV